MPLDKRRVQTAVIDDADSESPVVLPMEAIELDDFRARHADRTYWCGMWLGGCGHQLTTKLYTDRACHFAHVPDPEHTSACTRKASGVSSADHLYIKHGLLNWLQEQDITATAAIPRDADGSIGREVLFAPAGHDALRVLLTAAGNSPTTASADSAHLVLGPEAAHDPDVMLQQGYVNRIKLIPDGTRRRIQIGTQRHGGTTEWFELDQAALTGTGLSTPAVEEIRRLRTTRQLIGARPQPKAAPPPPDSRASSKSHDSSNAHSVPSPDRIAVMASLQEAVDDGTSRREICHWLDRAETVTQGGATAAENDLIRAAADTLLRMERAVGLPTPRQPTFLEKKALQKVERLLHDLGQQKNRGFETISARQRNQLSTAAKQASAWLTVDQRAKVDAWQKTPTALPTEHRRTRPPAAVVPPSRTLSAAVRHERFDAASQTDTIRDILEHAARLGKTVPLSTLRTQVPGLAHLTESDQVDVLRQVRPTTQHHSAKPQRPAMLTALITTDTGAMPGFFPQLANRAGHYVPAQADNAWANMIQALHDRYRT